MDIIFSMKFVLGLAFGLVVCAIIDLKCLRKCIKQKYIIYNNNRYCIIKTHSNYDSVKEWIK